MPRLSPDAPFLHPEVELAGETRFGAYVEIGRGSRVTDSTLGDYSYCDRYADIANADIGKMANIAAFSRIGATDHPLEKASLHHFHYRSADYWDDAEPDHAWFAHRRARRATIGHETWIGAHAQVRPEVTMGVGSVAASGAVVTRDVASFWIVAGVPARPLRRRFPDAVCDGLLALAWWDWDHATLRDRLEDFRTLTAEAFLARYG
jgi:phosphonate metabolism protein (transferase hexapeptide repeat family)